MFISVANTIESVLFAAIYAVLLGICFVKHLGILQSAGYSGRRYLKWLNKKGNLAFARIMLLATAILFSSAVLALCVAYLKEYSALLSTAAFLLFLIVYIVADRKIALRSPATFTPRLKRLFACFVLILAVVAYFAISLLNLLDSVWGNDYFTVLRYVPMSILPVLAIALLLLANVIMKVYELPHNKRFVKSACKKLSQSNVKTVAITGSFAKTSVKFILSDILKKRFSVISTPRSHNTPMGVSLTLNRADLTQTDIFIAEMGARHEGDIKELCELFPPDYAVITGICPQHLESFLTVENIVKAKGEIIEPTKNCVLIPTDISKYYIDEKIKVVDCVSEVVADRNGCQFCLSLGGEKKVVKTKLLGEHSARNIGLAAALAFELGVSFDEICEAIGELEFVEHRLQLIKKNGVNILDDGYNSNILGAEAAIEVLKMFSGKKIAVTPGLVELGVLEKDENFSLGQKLVGLDSVILVGDTLIQSVKDGYISANGDPQKLIVATTLTEAQTVLSGIIESGDSVLFLNDLPDIY